MQRRINVARLRIRDHVCHARHVKHLGFYITIHESMGTFLLFYKRTEIFDIKYGQIKLFRIKMLRYISF